MAVAAAVVVAVAAVAMVVATRLPNGNGQRVSRDECEGQYGGHYR